MSAATIDLNPQGAQMADYVIVDTLATPVWPVAVVRQHFDEVTASILNPEHYAAWHLPIDSGVKP